MQIVDTFPIQRVMIELLSHDQLQVLQDIGSVTSYEPDIHERSDDFALFNSQILINLICKSIAEWKAYQVLPSYQPYQLLLCVRVFFLAFLLPYVPVTKSKAGKKIEPFHGTEFVSCTLWQSMGWKQQIILLEYLLIRDVISSHLKFGASNELSALQTSQIDGIVVLKLHWK